MSILSAAELAAIRADVANMLPSTCDLLAVARTSDGQGGFTETWGTATADVACRLDYVRGLKAYYGGALQPYTGWMLTLPYDTAISTAYRVLHNGVTYTVTGEDSHKDWPVSVRVMVEAL